MSDLKLVRTLTTNFSMYQGLKAIPIGLLLLVISLWANAQAGPAPGLFFPITLSIVFICLYWIVHRFYGRVFGVVVPEKKQKRTRLVSDAGIGVGALAAFWVDVTFSPAFSALGLVFAAALLVDYARIVRKTEERLLLFYPAAALLMAALSLLPAFGIEWWVSLGIKAQLLAVCAAAGLMFTVLGLIGHISFENLLLRMEEMSGE